MVKNEVSTFPLNEHGTGCAFTSLVSSRNEQCSEGLSKEEWNLTGDLALRRKREITHISLWRAMGPKIQMLAIKMMSYFPINMFSK